MATKCRNICSGDLVHYISISTRQLQVNASDADFNMLFTDAVDYLAKLETPSGELLFDGVNIETPITHVFTIRHDADVEQNGANRWISYNGKRIRIVSTKNIEEKNEWLELKCQATGLLSKAASNA